MGSYRYRTAAIGLAVLMSGSALAGCGGEDSSGASDTITVWSLENLKPRMAVTQKIVDRFEEKSGVKVELVGVDEAQFPQLIMTAAAAGDLPDAIGSVPMGQIWQMHTNGLLETFRSNVLKAPH
jgi:multiple sugar transport system substrate-binding protein